MFQGRLWLVSMQLTMCDPSQGLVEGRRVTVISECDTHAAGQKPSRQSKSLFVLQKPGPESLIVHFVTLATIQKQTHTELISENKSFEGRTCWLSYLLLFFRRVIWRSINAAAPEIQCVTLAGSTDNILNYLLSFQVCMSTTDNFVWMWTSECTVAKDEK